MPDITRAYDSMAFKTIATVKVINGSITPQSPLLLFRLRRSIWWEEHNIKSTLSTHFEVHSTESLTVGAMLVSRFQNLFVQRDGSFVPVEEQRPARPPHSPSPSPWQPPSCPPCVWA